MATDRSNAMDHVVVVLFENRSLDNVLGHLYGPEDGKTFEGVIGKDLSNPIPEWAEDGADRKVVPYTVATDMDSPNPDSGEEYPHTNTQLFNILNEANRFKLLDDIAAPYNAPAPGQTPTMDGFVTDYISSFTAEMGRQPTYEEYAQIMTGFTPEQVPVLNGLARGFGVFDHWFCEVPSQTLPNRSFWTAATSSGFAWNAPAKKFITNNNAETIFNRLDDHGKTWKVYVSEPAAFSGTALVHFQRLKDQFATHFVPFSQFEADAANGSCPTSRSSSRASSSATTTTTPLSVGPWVTAWSCPASTRRRRSSAAKSSCHGSTPPTGGCRARRAPTSGTRRCSSAGTSRAAPMTTSRRLPCRVRIRRLRPASTASRSTGPAIESRPSSCRRGSPKARCSTRSTATRR